MTLLDMLLQPFQLEFMRYALIISVLVGDPDRTALLLPRPQGLVADG